MEKIKSLNRYQKAVLIFMTTMSLVFTVAYTIITSQIGFEYMGKILIPSQENGSSSYSGKIQGQEAHFRVTKDRTVLFKHGDKTYGPYTAKKDPSAIPKNVEMAEYMTGVELHRGEEILFRGGVLDFGDSYRLFNEDGSLENFGFSYEDIDGTRRDEKDKIIDPLEPSASTILRLMSGPDLTHKGEWFLFSYAVLICIINALSILFVDELFRWNLSFQIRDVDHVEPSDWAITGRYISWTILTIVALVLFIRGLL